MIRSRSQAGFDTPPSWMKGDINLDDCTLTRAEYWDGKTPQPEPQPRPKGRNAVRRTV